MLRAWVGRLVTSRLCSRTLPSSASVRPAMILSTVVLPLPLEPSRTKNSPFLISRETLLTTTCSPYLLLTPSKTIDIRSPAIAHIIQEKRLSPINLWINSLFRENTVPVRLIGASCAPLLCEQRYQQGWCYRALARFGCAHPTWPSA